MTRTLKTLVLKTVKVTGVKLGTPADRIGLGLVVATYPTDNLSPGHFPMPLNPEPEQARSRQLSASHMQPQMRRHSDGDAVPPAGSTGCSPGSTASRFLPASAGSLTRSWRGTTRTAATGGFRIGATALVAATGRANFPGGLRHDDRPGDCQSHGRSGGKREVSIRRVTPAAEAGK